MYSQPWKNWAVLSGYFKTIFNATFSYNYNYFLQYRSSITQVCEGDISDSFLAPPILHTYYSYLFKNITNISHRYLDKKNLAKVKGWHDIFLSPGRKEVNKKGGREDTKLKDRQKLTSAIHSHSENLALLADRNALGSLLVTVWNTRVATSTDNLQLVPMYDTQVALAFFRLWHNHHLEQDI